MKIAFISKHQNLNIKNWSGTEYYTAKSLAKESELYTISGLEEKLVLSVRLKQKIYGRDKKYWIKRSPEAGKYYAKQIKKKLQPSTDIIFSTNTETIAYLKTDIPKVFYVDATFDSMLNYYDWFDNISSRTIKESTKMEQLAIDSSALAIFSSDWAANNAIEKYNADPQKVKVIPFGANIDNYLSIENIEGVVRARSVDRCEILFIASDWYRKGGDIVLKAVEYLNETLKLDTILHIVGINNLSNQVLPQYIKNYGWIDKSTIEGQSKFKDLISKSHFFFLPSRAECFGIVFCEAMSYGIPCISTNTGGIPTIIKNMENGILLETDSSPEMYADIIFKLFKDRFTYETISSNAFSDYNLRLNWKVASKKLLSYFEDLI